VAPYGVAGFAEMISQDEERNLVSKKNAPVLLVVGASEGQARKKSDELLAAIVAEQDQQVQKGKLLKVTGVNVADVVTVDLKRFEKLYARRSLLRSEVEQKGTFPQAFLFTGKPNAKGDRIFTAVGLGNLPGNVVPVKVAKSPKAASPAQTGKRERKGFDDIETAKIDDMEVQKSDPPPSTDLTKNLKVAKTAPQKHNPVETLDASKKDDADNMLLRLQGGEVPIILVIGAREDRVVKKWMVSAADADLSGTGATFVYLLDSTNGFNDEVQRESLDQKKNLKGLKRILRDRFGGMEKAAFLDDGRAILLCTPKRERGWTCVPHVFPETK